MKYNKELNGVYHADDGEYVYLVKFKDGISGCGLKNSQYPRNRNFNTFFPISSFNEDFSDYDYTPANEYYTNWLESCIEIGKFTLQVERIELEEPLLFN